MRRVLVAMLLMGGVAHADTQQEAGVHFERGETARNEGRYREAITEYEQAYDLVPHPFALYNIGICYEKLGDWKQAADYFERYLDKDKSAADASIVTEKIRELRRKAGAGVITPGDPGSSATTDVPVDDGHGKPGVHMGIPPVPLAEIPRWHGGVSYGLGFGDALTERLLAHAGIRIGAHFDLDGILGQFGKNDRAIGAMGRLKLWQNGVVTAYAHGAATIGYAKQDHSSDATTKFPFGFEAGGGVQLGARGRVEIDAVIRWTRGGFDESSTIVDSYTNDSMAFAIDLGLAFDVPTSVGR